MIASLLRLQSKFKVRGLSGKIVDWDAPGHRLNLHNCKKKKKRERERRREKKTYLFPVSFENSNYFLPCMDPVCLSLFISCLHAFLFLCVCVFVLAGMHT